MRKADLYKDNQGNSFYLSVLDGGQLEKHEFQPRAIDSKRVRELKENIKTRGLMTPLIVSERKVGESVKYFILDGQHRFEALKSLNLLNEVQAKVYVNLSPETEMDICREANELRKRPNAGERYRTYNRIYDYYEEIFLKQGRDFTEEDLLLAQKAVTQQKQKEVIIGRIVEKLRSEPNFREYVSDAQIPKKVIIKEKKNSLITAQNLATFLSHLCRTKPITKKEKQTKDFANLRNQEYENIKHVMNFIVDEIFKPYISTDLDTAMDFCKHHPLSAIGKIIAEILLRSTAGGKPNAPSYNARIDWDKTEEYFEKLKEIDWKDPTISKERNLETLYVEIYKRVF